MAGVSVSGCLFYGIYLNTGFSTLVESCTVQTVGSYGIVAACVSRSAAYLCGDTAIFANTASDSYGYSLGSGDGVYADAAHNCYGYCSGSGIGLYAEEASNCHSYSSGGTGLFATAAASCFGRSAGGHGLVTTTAINCNGVNTSDGTVTYGLEATIAIGCYGSNTKTGWGLSAEIGNSSSGVSFYGAGVSVAHPYNMPP